MGSLLRRRSVLPWAIVLACTVTGACSPAETVPPARVPGIPLQATWAGGVDGGHWFFCTPLSSPARYRCRIYNEYSGTLTASGEFIPRRDGSDSGVSTQTSMVPVLSGALRYRYYDGETIHLADDVALVPDGVIDHPFGNGGGKRAHYRDGVQVGEEEQYGPRE